MVGHNDRRRNRRYDTDIPIIFRTFSSLDDHRAKELNHSYNGISFEGGVCLKPGIILYVRHDKCPENCPNGKACEGCRSATLATVKWCYEKEASKAGSYNVGARYFEYGIGY